MEHILIRNVRVARLWHKGNNVFFCFNCWLVNWISWATLVSRKKSLKNELKIILKFACPKVGKCLQLRRIFWSKTTVRKTAQIYFLRLLKIIWAVIPKCKTAWKLVNRFNILQLHIWSVALIGPKWMASQIEADQNDLIKTLKERTEENLRNGRWWK